MFKNDNNVIEVPVTNHLGEVIPATDFVNAKYQVFNSLSGDVLFTATLGDGIEATADHFLITTKAIDFEGQTLHEMRVVDIDGNESTILQTNLKMKDTRILL